MELEKLTNKVGTAHWKRAGAPRSNFLKTASLSSYPVTRFQTKIRKELSNLINRIIVDCLSFIHTFPRLNDYCSTNYWIVTPIFWKHLLQSVSAYQIIRHPKNDKANSFISFFRTGSERMVRCQIKFSLDNTYNKPNENIHSLFLFSVQRDFVYKITL